jgi:ornithine cyclodeaminase/alanine dehydrogenase-like protein (mu-crystallin family)
VTLHINESEVETIFTMSLAIEAVEKISQRQAAGEVLVHPRRRFELPESAFFHNMAAADVVGKFVATKQYTYVGGKLKFLVCLWSSGNGELLALIEADKLGQMRTGAASGVATKYLAQKDATTAGIIGTGGQARTQLEAIAAVRKLSAVKAYGRDAERRDKFASEMSSRLGISVQSVASSAEATSDAAIICTATTASAPVVSSEQVSPGTHINAIGANHMRKRELDAATVARCSRIYVDSIEQSRQEAGDLVLGFAGHEQRWDTVRELSSLVAGICPGRTEEAQITLFKSNGIAAWDLAAAICVYRIVQERKLGRQLPLWQSS